MKIKTINTTALAFMGDAVYEVYVRKHVMEKGGRAADKLHKMAVEYVKADSQALSIKKMLDDLSDEEKSLVRRAKNHKIATKAKNASIMSYKWATAFEALLGYLYLDGNIERMEEIIYVAMEVIDEQSR